MLTISPSAVRVGVPENDWYEAIHCDVAAGNRVMLVFRSKNIMQSFLTILRGKHPTLASEAILAFDGDSSDAHMKCWENIDCIIQERGILCLSFTSKVLCGADVQTPFYRVYVHCSHGEGPTARDVFQMIGRCRNCESRQIYVTFPEKKEKKAACKAAPEETTTHAAVLKRLLDKKEFRDPIVKAILREMQPIYNPHTGQLEHPAHSPTWTPPWFLSLYAWVKLEQQENFKATFYRHSCRKGYHLQLGGCPDGKEHIIAVCQELKELREENQQTRGLTLKMLQDLTNDELQKRATELKRTRTTLPPNKKVEMQICFILLHVLPDERKHIDCKHINFLENNHTAIQFAQIIQRGNCLALRERITDLQGLGKSNLPEEHELFTKLADDLRILLPRLGFCDTTKSGLFDFETGLYGAKLVTQLLHKHNRGILRSLQSNLKQNLLFKNKKTAITDLRHVLRRLGHTISAVKKEQGKRKRDRKRSKGGAQKQLYSLSLHPKVAELIDKVRPLQLPPSAPKRAADSLPDTAPSPKRARVETD